MIFFFLAGVLGFFLSKQAEKKRALDSDRMGLIGKAKNSTPLGRQITASPFVEDGEVGEKSKSRNSRMDVGGRIYWNNYI